jgi:uncharacterized caspase-like protein
MSRWATGITILVVALVTASTAVARGPYGSIKVGNWSGGAFTNDADGSFSGCIASTGYQSGVVVSVIVGAEGNWRLGFLHQAWTFVIGQDFPMVLTFDGKSPPTNVGGKPISINQVAVEMPTNSALIAQFRKAKAMSVFAQGQLFQFMLDGTGQLMPTLANCVAKVREGGISNAGDFNVTLPKSTKAPAEPGSSSASSAPVASVGEHISAPVQPNSNPVTEQSPVSVGLPGPTPTFAPVATPITEKRVALVIGIGNYQNVPRLNNPTNDARLMADTLLSLGFTLVGGGAQLDLDKAGFDASVQSFGNQLQGASVGLFYYAGHGVQVGGANYLVPVGANPNKEADVDFQMLNTNLVLRQMEGAGTKLNIVFLDACRNNPFGGRGLRAMERGLAQMQAPEGTLISFATQPGNVALDGSQGNSPFTSALARTIRKPGLGIFDALNEVGLTVKRATGGAQQPWFSTSPLSGTFYFASAPNVQQSTGSPTVAPAPPAQPRITTAPQISVKPNATNAPSKRPPPQAAPSPVTSGTANGDALILPKAISPEYSTDDPGRARMHTCVDQYNANKVTNSNGGLKWIEKGGGYYSVCNQHLKS